MVEFIDGHKYSGFLIPEQELKYNSTLFDLIMTLSARVTASLKFCKFHNQPKRKGQPRKKNSKFLKLIILLNI